MGQKWGDRARSGQRPPSARFAWVDYAIPRYVPSKVSVLFTVPAKWPLFYHTCWESNSTIKSGVLLGCVQILFTFDVFFRIGRRFFRIGCHTFVSDPKENIGKNTKKLETTWKMSVWTLAWCENSSLLTTTTKIKNLIKTHMNQNCPKVSRHTRQAFYELQEHWLIWFTSTLTNMLYKRIDLQAHWQIWFTSALTNMIYKHTNMMYKRMDHHDLRAHWPNPHPAMVWLRLVGSIKL